MKPLYYIFGAIAAYTLYTYSKLAKSLSYSINDVNVTGTVFKPVVNLFLKIGNPTNQSATLQSISGEVYINSKVIANFENFTPQFIQQNNFTVIKISARPYLLGAINLVNNFIINKGKGQINVEVKGLANVDGNTVNFTNKINL
jgi:LEA14-like dessication related protein